MKNAILIVVAFVLGGAAVWYLTGRNDGAQVAGPRGGQSFGGAGRPGGFGGSGAQAPLVAVERVKHQELYDTVDALGTAQANESVTLSAKVTDTVRSVNFEDGDFVEAGAVLLELTNQRREALLAEARANLDDAQNQLRRLEESRGRGLASASDLDVARSREAATAGASQHRRRAPTRPSDPGAFRGRARLPQGEPRHAASPRTRRSRRSTTSRRSSSTSRCRRRSSAP